VRRSAPHAIRLLPLLALLLAAGALASCGSSAKTPVYVGCTEVSGKYSLANVAHEHPANCNLLGFPYNEARLARLTKIAWSNWGSSSALGTGGLLPNHCNVGERCLNHCGEHCVASPSGPVTLSNIQKGCEGRQYYTRAEVAGRQLILSGRC
jgi:hypothetical protein